jgi:hypothetical protein
VVELGQTSHADPARVLSGSHISTGALPDLCRTDLTDALGSTSCKAAAAAAGAAVLSEALAPA